MEPVPFEVESEKLEGGVRAVAVRGELDLSTAPELDRVLEEAVAAEASILLDLSACDFIDSTGIALIVRVWQRLGKQDGRPRLVVCSVNQQVRRLLSITGVEDAISMHERRETALAELGR